MTETTNIISTIDPKLFNNYFQSINSDAYYTVPERVVIPELLVFQWLRFTW